MDPQPGSDPLNIACPHCHAANRVDTDRLGEAQCSECGKALFEGRPVAVDADAFERHIGRSDLPVVVDFWAPWCAPCRMMAPVFDAAAREMEPRLRFLKVNTDEERTLAARHRIYGIPTFAIFKRGVEVARTSGAMTAGSFAAWIRSHD
jgi:thioredoxin 2